ncbi:MAG: DUF4337 domain-containing protein [Desulfobaccales bacterium]
MAIKEVIEKIIEQVKDFLGEWDSKETGQSGENWRNKIALTAALIALLGAFFGLFETNQVAEMIVDMNNAVINQTIASDRWSWYQAKDIRRHLYDVSAKAQDRTDPPLASEYRKKSEKYEKDQKDLNKEATKFEKMAKDSNDSSDQHKHLHLYSAMSVTAIEISIALLAISAYTRKKYLWLFAIIIGFGGFCVFVLGLYRYPQAWTRITSFL